MIWTRFTSTPFWRSSVGLNGRIPDMLGFLGSRGFDFDHVETVLVLLQNIDGNEHCICFKGSFIQDTGAGSQGLLC